MENSDGNNTDNALQVAIAKLDEALVPIQRATIGAIVFLGAIFAGLALDQTQKASEASAQASENNE